MKRNSKTGRALSGKTLLELLAAAFILLGPSVLEGAVGGWGLYAVFILTAAVFVIRLIETKKIHISVNILLCGLCFLYALPVFFWAVSRYSHIKLIFTALTVTIGTMLTADYLEIEKDRDIGNRLVSMMSVSALICAFWNLISWVAFNGLSMDKAFSAGLGNSDLLGVFMLVGLWCCAKTFGGRKKPGAAIVVMDLPMVFVLIMSRSLLTGLCGGLFALCYSIKKHKSLQCAWWGLVTAASAAALLLMGTSPKMTPFADGLFRGMLNPGGLGGGGFIFRQDQYQSVYYVITELGTGADMASSLGVVGLLACVAFIGWALYLTISKSSWQCAFGSTLCMFAFFVPLGGGLASLVLLMGVLVYGEWSQERVLTLKVGRGSTVVAGLIAVLAVYSCVLAVGEGIKAAGVNGLYTDPRNGVQKLTSAAKLNPFDGESCFMAAQGYRQLYEAEGVRNDIVNAEYYIEKAIERDEGCARYYALQACIKADSGDPAGAVELDRLTMEQAPLWEDCRVQMAEHLYALIQTVEKGSLTAQKYHLEILGLSDEVSDMDRKKTINDFADRAQDYIRKDFGFEQPEEDYQE